jgi:tryptophan synthase alpha chain
MGVAAISEAFARARARGGTALIPYAPVGYPSLAATLDIVPALAAAGAALIELGIPFSDPLADGATIQRATHAALANGVTFDRCLETAAALRARVAVPLLFMGYYNPFHRRGVARAVAECAAAGIAGLIIPDLPPEEAGPLRAACEEHDVAVIFLVAPTSSDARLARVGAAGSGFLYCVSLAGVTGARRALPPGLPAYLARVRRHTRLPLAVGFGLSTAEHVAAVGRVADGAVIASALINHIEQAPGREAEAARAFMAGLQPQPIGG